MIDALLIAQFYVGLITQFPGAPIPSAVQAYYQALASGTRQDRNTTVSVKAASQAGRYK